MRRTSLLIGFLSLIAMFAVSCLSSEERVISANESAARASIRTLGTGQLLYRSNKGAFATLKQLGDNHIIDAPLASGVKSGYRFETRPGATKDLQFTIIGSPVEPGKSGRKYFFVDEAQVLRCTASPPATAQSPECK